MKRPKRTIRSKLHLKTRAKRSAKTGLPPGSLVRVGSHVEAGTGHMQMFEYNEQELREVTLKGLADIATLDPKRIYWINIDEIDDTDLVAAIGERFHLHALLLEDILNTDHRPKIEEFEDHVFVVLKMIALSPDENKLVSEQISFVLGSNYVLSFQENPGDIFEPVRGRIRMGLGRLRKKGADYLLYALVDLIVDHYFHIIEELSERIETLEHQVVDDPKNMHLNDIMGMRSLLIKLRRSATPTQELASKVELISSHLITDETKRFFGDVKDHSLHVSDSILVFRDTMNGLEQTYHAMVNLKTSRVVNLLTIISAIFIPLTFVAGIYGMNFENMPELHSPNGYYYTIAGMGILAITLLSVFRWKKWL